MVTPMMIIMMIKYHYDAKPRHKVAKLPRSKDKDFYQVEPSEKFRTNEHHYSDLHPSNAMMINVTFLTTILKIFVAPQNINFSIVIALVIIRKLLRNCPKFHK